MMIAYKKINGRAVDIRFVGKDYAAEPDEILVEGDILPDAAELSDVPPPSVGEEKSRAIRSIDTAAEAARLRYITGGAGQAATYILKEQQARAYVAAGYPASMDGWPMIRAEVLARGEGLQFADARRAAADSIVAMAEQWQALAAAIEEQRLTGKRLVDAAADAESVRAAETAAVAALGQI